MGLVLEITKIIPILLFPMPAAVLCAANKTKEVCYAEVGCFSLEPPWSTVQRPLPTPESPDTIKLQFYLTTR